MVRSRRGLFARLTGGAARRRRPRRRIVGSAETSLEVVARVADCLVAESDFDAAVQCAFDILSEELDRTPFTLSLLGHDAGGEYLALTASRLLDAEQRKLVAHHRLHDSLPGLVARTRKPLILEHVDRDTRPMTLVARVLGCRAFAGYPLLAEDRLLGVVCFAPRGTPVFRPDQLVLARTVTAQVASAMERHRLEQVAREDETRLRLALLVSGMGAWSWDWRRAMVMPDAQLAVLHTLADIAPGGVTSAQFLEHVHPEDRPVVHEAVRDCAEGAGAIRCDYRIVLPGNRLRWLAIHGHAMARRGTEAPLMVGLVREITAEVEARRGLEREAEGFETLAQERAVLLAATEDRLARAAKMEALGRLAGGIAHDFNNILQAVDGSIGLSMRMLRAEPDGAERFLTIAAEACRRGASITDRLLAFGRRSPLQPEPLSPRFLLLGLAEMLRATLGPAIEVMVEARADLPPVLADRGRLEAVLVNLATNARDAMPDGGRLRLLADVPGRGEQAADALPPGAPGMIRLRVIDEGEGMASDVLARVSEPFFTTKPARRGSGLGLAMARGFAEQSGGVLTIESVRGRGTTVTLHLPAAFGPAPATPHAERPAAPRRLRPASLLLVEDIPEVRAVLTAELAEHGHDVTAVATADAALRLLEGGVRPDALVSDLGLAGPVDGLALLAQARRHIAGLPAVLITGNLVDTDAAGFAALERTGPLAILRKPASRQVICDRIEDVLERASRVAPPDPA